ncbi:MAG: hypothetical protein WC224_00235 [Sphaerochaetaceae bacterium]
MRRVLIPLLLVLALFSSCTSVSSWVRSSFEGVPSWVYEPKPARNQLAFVGQGETTSEVRSRIQAYESILKQISQYIGDDVFDRYFAELSTSKTIRDYQLKITQEFVKEEGTRVQVYFLAIADKAALQKARSESEVRLSEHEQEMDKLNRQAIQAFRDNKDIVALFSYIKIADIAYSMPAESGLARYNQAITRIKEIVEPLTFSVSTGEPDNVTTTVTLRRGKRALSPRVIEAPVVVYAPARDGLGSAYLDFQKFVTNQNGQFVYTTNNPTIVNQGELVVAVDIADELEVIRQIDPLFHTALMQIINSKRVTYPYKRVPKTLKEELLLTVSEFNLRGELINSSYVAQAIQHELAKDGIIGEVQVFGPLEEEETYIEKLRLLHPSRSYAIVGQVGISDLKELKTRVAVTVTGEISLVNLKTKQVLGSTGDVIANAVERTLSEATAKAFEKFGTISVFLLYRYLYN